MLAEDFKTDPYGTEQNWFAYFLLLFLFLDFFFIPFLVLLGGLLYIPFDYFIRDSLLNIFILSEK